jgi:hypothetical protein
MAAIVCEKLTKHYGPVVGLDAVDLTVLRTSVCGAFCRYFALAQASSGAKTHGK